MSRKDLKKKKKKRKKNKSNICSEDVKGLMGLNFSSVLNHKSLLNLIFIFPG